ncbi:MAG: response regulator [Hydrococcus sp. Prado102]|jgi:CheY-like chemotaxis protein|nr:response regulator [Hydrococcus sp. Prado102]
MKKILVIENEAQIREMFLESLEAEGFRAFSAQNGLIGILKAREVLPDLVICDLLVPELNGCEVLNGLRQNPFTATIPFIFLTSKTIEAKCHYSKESEADVYLLKPCTVEDLLDAIARVFETQQ